MSIPTYIEPKSLVPGVQQRGLRVFTDENKAALFSAVAGDDSVFPPKLPVTIKMAAGLVGISWNTVDTWMKQGALELHQWECGVIEKITPLAEFSKMMNISETKFKAKLIQETWDKAAQDGKGLTWQAYVTIAERLFPSEFGQTQRIEGNINTTNTEVKITWNRVDGTDWTNPQAPIPAPPNEDVVDVTFE